MSNYLVGLKKFNLGQVKERSGFNYFSYAIVKGQFETASVMLAQLQSNKKATEEVINPVIKSVQGIKINLLELCVKKSYKSGIKFLIQKCQVIPTQNQQILISALLDESNTSQSAYGNVTSMIDSTSRQTNDTNFSLKSNDITSLARRL